MKKGRFNFYEEVVVESTDSSLAEITGKTGVILGMAEPMEGREDEYGVLIYATDEVWQMSEANIRSTGRVRKREDFYDGSSIRIAVDENGRGTIV